jgi:hypothetical protein
MAYVFAMTQVTLVFRARCGNGHTTQQIFTRELLDPSVVPGSVTFHCETCGARWEPNVEERVRLRALAKRLRRSPESFNDAGGIQSGAWTAGLLC